MKTAFLSGELKPGEELPSIRRLAQELRVSVITTKRAYDDLEREGYIKTLPARGSFAADPDKDLLRERRLEALRGSLEPLVGEALSLGLSASRLGDIVAAIYKEKENA